MINGTCGVLQFGLLPLMMKKLDPKWIWRAMPAILVGLTAVQYIQKLPSLFLVSLAFFALKVMDYSSRATANELVCITASYRIDQFHVLFACVSICASRAVIL
jgi:hypothetical protein